jgi:hypothetical protein
MALTLRIKHAQVHPHPPNHPLLPVHLVLPSANSSFLCHSLRPKRSHPGRMRSVRAFLHSHYIASVFHPDLLRCSNDPACVCLNPAFIGAVTTCVQQSCSAEDAQAAAAVYAALCSGATSGTGNHSPIIIGSIHLLKKIVACS